jgi:hypothetical protein
MVRTAIRSRLNFSRAERDDDDARYLNCLSLRPSRRQIAFN